MISVISNCNILIFSLWRGGEQVEALEQKLTSSDFLEKPSECQAEKKVCESWGETRYEKASLETFILGHCLFLVSPSSARRSRAWVSVVAFFLSCAVCMPWLITLSGRDRETSVPTSMTTGWGPTSSYELEAAF